MHIMRTTEQRACRRFEFSRWTRGPGESVNNGTACVSGLDLRLRLAHAGSYANRDYTFSNERPSLCGASKGTIETATH